MGMTDRTWPEWFTWHLRQTPHQIQHMRERAEQTVRAQDTSAVVVDGSSDKARLPYRVEPADDADELYTALVLFGREVAEKVGGAAPRPLRERMWHGRDEPQGLPVCTPSEAYTLTSEIAVWLHSILHELEWRTAAGDFGDSPDYLAALIRQMRARYPRAEPKYRAYRPRPCPTCGERTLHPTFGPTAEHITLTCDNCRDTFPKKGGTTP